MGADRGPPQRAREENPEGKPQNVAEAPQGDAAGDSANEGVLERQRANINRAST